MKKIALILFIGLSSLTSLVYALAQPDTEQNVNLDATMKQACSDKSEGDVCDFSNNVGDSINGSCRRSGSADSLLVCVPNN